MEPLAQLLVDALSSWHPDAIRNYIPEPLQPRMMVRFRERNPAFAR